jgi:S1-C subfamily serine protease
MVMFNRAEKNIVLISLLILIPITAGLTSYVILQEREKMAMSSRNNGYTEPKYLGWLIGESQKSLVTVNCESTLGSGFSFYLDEVDREEGFEFLDKSSEGADSIIITNHHVIEDCIDRGYVDITIADESIHKAEIVRLDAFNDLALLNASVEIVPISGAAWKPNPGFWTMALGSPHNFAGSVTLGNIINQESNQVFHTASLSPGNSGGPLLDNEGYLYAVNTGSKPVGQNFNLSVGVNAFCDKLISCSKARYWEEK